MCGELTEIFLPVESFGAHPKSSIIFEKDIATLVGISGFQTRPEYVFFRLNNKPDKRALQRLVECWQKSSAAKQIIHHAPKEKNLYRL